MRFLSRCFSFRAKIVLVAVIVSWSVSVIVTTVVNVLGTPVVVVITVTYTVLF
jgi:hypothetical protein